MIEYRFLAVAEEEMTEAAVFYEEASLHLGTEFLNDVQRVVNTVRVHPALGAPIGNGLRRVHLHRFPFSLIYVHPEETSEIVVVAVAHEKRRPGYWRGRSSAG